MGNTRPRLLDLFCGIQLPYNTIGGIIEIWLKLNVSIVKKNLRRSGLIQNGVREDVGVWQQKIGQKNAYANIVVRNSVRQDVHVNIAQYLVLIMPHGQQRKYGNAADVENHSHLEMLAMLIGDIALKLAKKELYLRKVNHGGKLTQKLTRFISEPIWQRILGLIATRLDGIALKPSAYWGANV